LASVAKNGNDEQFDGFFVQIPWAIVILLVENLYKKSRKIDKLTFKQMQSSLMESPD